MKFKIGVSLFILAVVTIVFLGRNYFLESRIQAYKNGTAQYLDMGG